MTKIVIDKPNLEDVVTLWKWGEENWELWGDEETKWFSKKSLTEWITNPREDILLVARVDGKLAGLCFNYNLRSWAYCAGLYVDKPHRSKGIAKRLVDETIKILRKNRIEEIVFLVDFKNNDGMKFYKKIKCQEGHHFVWMYKKTLKEGV